MSLRLMVVAVVTAVVTVATAVPAAASDIDLQLVDLKPMSTPVCAGTTPTFRAFIHNNGATESGFFNIRWVVDGNLMFDGGHNSIAAGATDTHDHIWSAGSGSGPTTITAGSHTVRFIADFDNRIGETNENNNERTLTVEAIACGPGGGTVPAKYVALGDSYSAGDGALDYIASSGGCRQSNNAYPKVLAAGLVPGVRVPTDLIFYACSGNKVADVRNNQMPLFRVIDAPSVKFVTITVGGNDVGFVPVLLNCLGGDVATAKCVGQTAAVTKVIIAQATPLTSLYQSIKAAAPTARVLVLGYPRLFPVNQSGGCAGFSAASQKWFNGEEQLLNGTIRAAAQRAGVEYLDTYGAFTGHELCTADTYVNGFPETPNQTAAHPKAVGQAKLANVIGDYLRARPLSY